MKYFIIRYDFDTKKREIKAEPKSYDDAKAEYRRLQGIYPSVQLSLVVENEYGVQMPIHSGYWVMS